ncbi:hypothetical protein ACEWY4_012764 [Coilia grayii]|uniref:TRAF3-interacting JNK-activating modulator-like n=1 Tax=Coilia grayii TaxID=363190 RepID=A0ABD1JUC9_9TELE
METDNALKRQWLRTESYDQRLEHRAAKHECLRDRNNVTTCRSPGTPQESEWKSNMRRKRQREFQKRRQISNEAIPVAAVPVSGKDKGPKEKVTLRGNRRKVPLIHRQSLVTSQDLGITWPDVNALAQASWMSLANTDQEHDTGMTGNIPDTVSSTASLRRSARGCERVQNNQRSRHISVSDFSSQTECGYITIKEEDLVQLGEYLKEALWREETLKQKLALLQQETSSLLIYCDKMWRACFKEDLLKCKIGALESQLQVCIQRFSKDEGKRLLMLMEEQFRLEEERAVASLQRVTEERAQALEKVASLERALESAQEKSSHWQQLHEEQGSVCVQLRASLQQSTDQIHTLQSQVEKSALHESLLQEQLQQLQDQYDRLHDHSSPLDQYDQYDRFHDHSSPSDQDDQYDRLHDHSSPLEQYDQYDRFHDHSSPSDQDQHCVERMEHNSTATASAQHCTDQVHPHKEKQISVAGPEQPPTDHTSQAGGKALQAGSAPKNRGMRHHILQAGLCLLMLVLLLVAMTLLWFHHPMNKEELEKVYLIMEDFAERCIQEVTSPDYPRCFKPI